MTEPWIDVPFWRRVCRAFERLFALVLFAGAHYAIEIFILPFIFQGSIMQRVLTVFFSAIFFLIYLGLVIDTVAVFSPNPSVSHPPKVASSVPSIPGQSVATATSEPPTT